MSNYARISKATNELDKAEKRLLYSKVLTDELVEYLADLLKGSEISKELQKIIDSSILSASKYFGVNTMAKSFNLS